jgi:hypothetical protein
MTDTSLLDARRQPRRPGVPPQVTDRPPGTADALLLDTDVAERRCWRCLQMFPGDSTQAPTPTPQWWLCDPCDRILLPARQRAA